MDWSDKENRLRGVFGNDVIKGRNFLESKRDFFNNLYKSCRADATPEEKMMLNVIRGETRKMDKLIYPNPAVRFITNIIANIKEGIKSYRQNRSVKEEMLSISLKRKPVEYDKKQTGMGKNNRTEVRESAKEVLDTYKRKGLKDKSQQTENKTVQSNDNNLMPKKRLNPNNGRSIY